MRHRLLRPAAALVGLAVGLAALLALPLAAQAHGGGTPRLTDAPAGPYRVYAWSLPEPFRAGEVHIDVALTLAGESESALQEPVTDADVELRFTPAAGGEPIVFQAVPQRFFNGAFYEAPVTLPAEGSWRIAVNVQGPAGSGVTEFDVEALPARTVNWGLVGGGAVALAGLAALGGLLSRRTAPKAQPSRSRPPTRRPAAQVVAGATGAAGTEDDDAS